MYAGVMPNQLAPVGEGAGAFKAGAAPTGRRSRRVVPLTDAQRLEAAETYRTTSASIRDLAKTYAVAYGTMHRALTEAGVTMRGRNGK